MSGLYGTLELGQRAVQTQRQGIELAGHNIANVDNPAFARQRIDVTTGPAIVDGNRILSTGVTAEQISQVRNQILDQGIQEEQSLTGFLEKKLELLERSEAHLGPSLLGNLSGDGSMPTGLRERLDALFHGFSDLANEPQSRSRRVALVEQASELTDELNQLSQRLGQLSQEIDSELDASVHQANKLATEIASLNQSIERVENQSQSTAHDLRDRRTAKLEELAQWTPFQVAESEDGILTLHVDGETILTGAQVTGTFQRVANAEGRQQAALVVDQQTRPLTQGKLGALGAVREETLIPLNSRLDDLANQLITNINAVHRTGFSLTGDTGADFFVGNDASSIRVATPLRDNPDRIQTAAQADTIGDNSILQSLTALAGTKQNALDNLTFAEHLTSTVSGYLDELSDTRDQLEDQQAVHDLLIRQRNAVSGVSLDEEMTNLVKYQNAFEASARLVSVVDEMLQTVVNLGR